MKRGNLVKILELAGKCINQNSNIRLISGESFEVVTSEFSENVLSRITLGMKCNSDFDILVPYKVITQVLKLADEDDIELKLKNNKLVIDYGKSKTEIKVNTYNNSYDEFTYNYKYEFNMSIDVLKNIVKLVAPSTSNSYSEPSLMAIHFVTRNGSLIAEAADGIRGSIYDTGIKTEEIEFLLPRKSIIKIASNIFGDVKIQLSDYKNASIANISSNSVGIDNCSASFVINLVSDNRFPDLTKLVSNLDCKYEFYVTVKQLKDAIERCKIFADNNDVVLFKNEKDNLLVISGNEVTGESINTIDYDKVKGDDFEIRYNYNYILDYINNIKKDSEVRFGFNSRAELAYLTHIDDDSFIYMISPIVVD